MSSRAVTATAFAATMALAGFLLFQVQPVLAKYILPWFGGSATTWIVAMLFFQVALLAGYALAYAITLPFPVTTQVKIQAALILLSLVLLPITPSDVWKPDDPANPTGKIVALLAASVGIPYVVLATTSPLLSRWLASADASLHPARFFAASNLGSFIGLLSYPFVFERLLSSNAQTVLWSWGYVFYGLLFAACALIAHRRTHDTVAVDGGALLRVARGSDPVALWVLYAALASILLLATTNAITQWSAVVPFLWILPLSLYLLTFVIAFGHQKLYHRAAYSIIFVLLAAIAVWLPYPDTSRELLVQIAVQCATLFFGCLICHAEMVRLQPEPRRLPKFYLAISVGGAMGGISIALFAPLVFGDYFEHPLVLGAIGLTACILLYREQRPVFARTALAGVALLATVLAVGGAAWNEIELRSYLVERVRNFYGVVSILEDEGDKPGDASLVMRQAGVDQGSQFADPARRMAPVCAFDWPSGVGLALSHHAKRRGGNAKTPLRIGIVGLGAGMVAALGREGDIIRYYEVNPAVDDLTSRYFTFVKDGKAKTDVLLGDARLVLERQLKQNQPQAFDVLVMNAFRGASPPMHLMTKEVFAIYMAHLAPNGILAINFELDTFEMAPLHRGMAKAFDLDVRWFETKLRPGCEEPISWALYTRDRAFFDQLEVRAAISHWRDRDGSSIVWTDKSSNLMSIINWGN